MVDRGRRQNASQLYQERFHYVIIERDEDGMYIGEAPGRPACYSQGRTIDELMANMREVIALCLEEIEGLDL